MNKLILNILSFLIGILLYKLLYNRECFINISNDLKLTTEDVCDPPVSYLHPEIENIKKYFNDKNINSLSDLFDGVSINEQYYDLNSFFEALSIVKENETKTGYTLYLGEDHNSNYIVICCMLGIWSQESDKFQTCNEYNPGQDGMCNNVYKNDDVNVWSDPNPGASNSKNTLINNDIMPCSCSNYMYYMGSNYTGGLSKLTSCETDWDMDIKSNDYGGHTNTMECKPNTKSGGCCWWGRGPTQITGQHNYYRLSKFLNTIDDYKDKNLCQNPKLICTSDDKKLIWLTSIWYWVEVVQTAIFDNYSNENNKDDPKSKIVNEKYKKSLENYTKMINDKNSSATDITFLDDIPTNPNGQSCWHWESDADKVYYPSVVGNIINMGNWFTKADDSNHRLSFTLTILKKLELINTDIIESNIYVNVCPTPTPANSDCCGTWSDKCTKVNGKDMCKSNNKINCVSGNSDRACRDTSKWQCEDCK
jgi:hypothetical protein